MIVTKQVPVSICLLWNHVEWGEPVAGRRLYDSQLQNVVKFLSCNSEAIGPIRQLWAETGGSVASMWYITPCLIGASDVRLV